jgi:hypothetical protein
MWLTRLYASCMLDDSILAGGIVRVSDPLDEPSTNTRSATAASRANRSEPPFHSANDRNLFAYRQQPVAMSRRTFADDRCEPVKRPNCDQASAALEYCLELQLVGCDLPRPSADAFSGSLEDRSAGSRPLD